jgi:integrase/recombinase XerD
MAEDLPGFIPRVLRLDDVSLLRADETVLEAMVDGWRAQMLARGLAVDTSRVQLLLGSASHSSGARELIVAAQ